MFERREKCKYLESLVVRYFLDFALLASGFTIQYVCYDLLSFVYLKIELTLFGRSNFYY